VRRRSEALLLDQLLRVGHQEPPHGGRLRRLLPEPIGADPAGQEALRARRLHLRQVPAAKVDRRVFVSSMSLERHSLLTML